MLTEISVDQVRVGKKSVQVILNLIAMGRVLVAAKRLLSCQKKNIFKDFVRQVFVCFLTRAQKTPHNPVTNKQTNCKM